MHNQTFQLTLRPVQIMVSTCEINNTPLIGKNMQNIQKRYRK